MSRVIRDYESLDNVVDLHMSHMVVATISHVAHYNEVMQPQVIIADDSGKELESAGAPFTRSGSSVGSNSPYACIVCEMEA